VEEKVVKMAREIKKLSKNLFNMKFMLRSKEKAEQKSLEEERSALFDHDVTEDMRKAGSKYIYESSYVVCEKLKFGRMSFRGFNTEVEKLMKEFQTGKEEPEKPIQKNEAEISDDEMAESLSTLRGTISKKFSTKRSRLESKGANKKQKTDEDDEEHIETSNIKTDKLDSKKQKIVEVKKTKQKAAEGKVPKQKHSNDEKEKPRDIMKEHYPKRKRAAEFWKPEEN